jgi:hypothetical protein
MAEPTSWILDVRRRLAAGPSLEPVVAESARVALLVPLFVEAGGLWALLSTGAGGEVELPSSPVAPGEDAWDAALRAAGAAGLPIETVLRLGELEALERPEGGLVLPCVGALPTAPALAVTEAAGTFRLPLAALANPTLAEDFEIEDADGNRRRVRAVHVGGRRLWGTAVWVLEDLLERLRG